MRYELCIKLSKLDFVTDSIIHGGSYLYHLTAFLPKMLIATEY